MGILNLNKALATSGRREAAVNSGRFAKSRSEVLARAGENFDRSAWMYPAQHRATVGAMMEHGVAGSDAITSYYAQTAVPMSPKRIGELGFLVRAQRGLL